MITELILDLHNLNIKNEEIDNILDSELLTFVAENKRYLEKLEPVIIMDKIYFKPIKLDNVSIKENNIEHKQYLTTLFKSILITSSNGIGLWFTDISGNSFSQEQHLDIRKDFAKYFFEI